MIEQSRIKCSGLRLCAALPEAIEAPLLTAIVNRKSHTKWLNANGGGDNWFHKGRRYCDNERVLKVIVGEVTSLIGEDKVNEYFSNVPVEELNMWIDESLRCSGSADYYYTFEKEWD